MLAIIFWIFCAIVCAILADNRNRNSLVWFLLGLLFGLFAIVIIAILPKVENEQYNPATITRLKRYDSKNFPHWPE